MAYNTLTNKMTNEYILILKKKKFLKECEEKALYFSFLRKLDFLKQNSNKK